MNDLIRLEQRFARRLFAIALFGMALTVLVDVQGRWMVFTSDAAPQIAAVLSNAAGPPDGSFAKIYRGLLNTRRHHRIRLLPPPLGQSPAFAYFGRAGPPLLSNDQLALGNVPLVYNASLQFPQPYAPPLLPIPARSSPGSFNLVAPLPDPASWISMIAGFLGIGLAMRRGRSRPVCGGRS